MTSGNPGKFTAKDEETGKVMIFGPLPSLLANKALHNGAHIYIITLSQVKNRKKPATAPRIESVTSLIIGKQRQRSPETNLPAGGAVKSNAGLFKDAHIKYHLYYPDLSGPYPEGTPNPISVEYEADTRTIRGLIAGSTIAKRAIKNSKVLFYGKVDEPWTGEADAYSLTKEDEEAACAAQPSDLMESNQKRFLVARTNKSKNWVNLKGCGLWQKRA